MTTTAEILSLAKGEVGTRETRVNGHWVNDSKYNRWFGKIPGYPRDGYDYPYCAAFVAWLADKAGVRGLYPHTASCEVGVSWFKQRGQFSEYPAIGAQVFFGKNGGSHTGIVYKYDETYIYTYEGNTNGNGSAEGDGVYDKKRLRRDSYVYGYGYPAFPEGLVTADPSKKNKPGFTCKATASAPVISFKTPEKETPVNTDKGNSMASARDFWKYKNEKQGEKNDAYWYLRSTKTEVDKLRAQVAKQGEAIDELLSLVRNMNRTMSG